MSEAIRWAFVAFVCACCGSVLWARRAVFKRLLDFLTPALCVAVLVFFCALVFG